jgi:molecular chaperone DnaJ
MPNHYEVLNIKTTATQAEIKQAYRRLVKLFHPDTNNQNSSHEQIIKLNAAYEVLSDPQRRHSYDRHLPQSRPSVKTENTRHQRSQAHKTRDTDEHLQQWLTQVYRPVNQILMRMIKSIDQEIEDLSADPFDDELLNAFQTYLQNSRHYLQQAKRIFWGLPNPANVAGVAANLYHCLQQIGDGIEELEFFTLNYDDHHLHTGIEIFRIAAELRREAQQAINHLVRS